MAVWMVGIDHNRAELDVRGRFSFTKKKMEAAYAAFQGMPGISGSVLLSTCNRTEWWISVTEDSFSPIQTFCALLDVEAKAFQPYFVERRDAAAVDHLFRLAAGLESRIVGEDQILTQVGDALQLARYYYAADHTLEVLFRHAVTAAKRVKTEVRLSTADKTVIHAALQQLADQGLELQGRPCMVIGNGMMGRLSAQALLDRGADVTVTVRQYTSGVVDIPRGCRRILYGERYDYLPRCTLVVSATSSPNYTLCRDALAALSIDHPVCLVDLAVPRDIEKTAGEVPLFTLYDIDAFQIDPMSEHFRQGLARAEVILEEEKQAFWSWYEGRDLVARIQGIKDRAACDVDARLTQIYRGVPLPPEGKAVLEREVEDASRRMMNHLLFGMKARLPEKAFSECLEAMEAVFTK